MLARPAPNGVIAADNTLHSGLVPHDAGDRAMLEDLHAFKHAVQQDPRVDQVVLTVRDDLTLIRRAH